MYICSTAMCNEIPLVCTCIKALSNTEILNDNDSLIMSTKVDIEGSELDALPEWIESGVLEKVKFS